MKIENKQLQASALEALNGKWNTAVIGTLIYLAIIIALSFVPILGSLTTLIIGGPLVYGLYFFYLSISRGQDFNLDMLFKGFNVFGKAFGVYILIVLFIMAWALIVVIPSICLGLTIASYENETFTNNPTLIAFTILSGLGIIAAIIPTIIAIFSYSMAYFILIDNPQFTAYDALKASKQMMVGYKWKLFCLYVRFIGWFLLSGLTCGIGILWLFPYVYVSNVKFYDDIKEG